MSARKMRQVEKRLANEMAAGEVVDRPAAIWLARRLSSCRILGADISRTPEVVTLDPLESYLNSVH